MVRTPIVVGVAFALAAFSFPTVSARAQAGTPINLSTALAFGDDSTCTHLPNSPCPASGTFTADDSTTASLVCEAGTIVETHWFTHGRRGPITIADRTWICPDGSTLVMHVTRWSFTPLTETTASISETWVITGGTGLLAGLQGSGTMEEVFDFGSTPETLGGSVTGVVR
jgi:hypothetical protein